MCDVSLPLIIYKYTKYTMGHTYIYLKNNVITCKLGVTSYVMTIFNILLYKSY
jgi:hypothetical protein